MTADAAEVLAEYAETFMDTYGAPRLALVRGDGSYVWDADGKRYLDLLGGIAVNAVGYAHPAWVRAVSEQAATLAHVSNFFATASQVELGRRLLSLADAPAGSRVFLCNSGTEANEAALKMALKAGRRRVVALEEAFHGRTMGALNLTHKPAARQPFEPYPVEATFVPANDEAALAAAMGPDVAAVFLEPIQGESGVRPLTGGFLAAARAHCDTHGSLLVFDEVQTGVGRTGLWFAHQAHGVRPDVMTLAKGLAGGFPIGAVVAFGAEASSLFVKGDHGTTFGGNSLACAAALATLSIIEAEGLLDNAKAVGQHTWEVASDIPGVAGVRGEGLMLGIVLEQPVAAEVVAAAVDAGFIANAPVPDVVRLLPALNVTAAEVDSFLEWFRGFLAAHSSPDSPDAKPGEENRT